MEESEMKATSEEVTESSEDDGSGSETELMVTTRAKRATAGNRYSTVVAQEEAAEDEEDDVALLFAEGEEEDEEYNSDEGADEADMSSSDDDDQGPTAGADDLEGEKEIEKEAKVERAKKRKAEMALTNVAGLRKKPKIDPTSIRRAAAPKPSKRKERVSWLPEQGNTSARPSLRAQTIAHRAETHAKLKVNEAQRLKMKAIREKREKEREADAPKELSQADRLAEAERIERKNAKSLNRWETMEKKRAEEQAAKLAALKERKLDGAVVTWYSASHKYNGLKDERETQAEVPTEGKKRGRKSKAFHEQMAAARLAESTTSNTVSSQQTLTPSTNALLPPATVPESQTPTEAIPAQVTFTTPQGPDNFFLKGIHEYASVSADKVELAPTQDQATIPSREATASPITNVNPALSPPKIQEKPTLPPNDQSGDLHTVPVPSVTTAKPEIDVIMAEAEEKPNSVASKQTTDLDIAYPKDLGASDSSQNDTITLIPLTHHLALSTTAVVPPSDPVASPTQSAPLIQVISTRNLIILDKFDDLTGQTRNEFGLFYNNRKTAKPAKHTPEVCMITGLAARYRDPVTGIGYANAAAYKKLQQMKQHQFAWSSMLSCYVGRSTFVARGVPEGFLGT